MYRGRHTKSKKAIGDYSKKKTGFYLERDEQERQDFVETIAALPEDTELFYGDESGFDEHYSRTYGYAPQGERVCGEIPGTHFERTSIVGAINSNNEFLAGFAFKGYMNGGLFCGWLEEVFAPALKNPTKSVLLLDNASHHPKNEIQAIADEYGFKVIFLPKYSPDLNKIEKYWANIKYWLRLHLHHFDTFWDGLVRAFGVR